MTCKVNLIVKLRISIIKDYKMSIKIINNDAYNVKFMSEMKPLELAIVIEPNGTHDGELVMRTASLNTFEVMNLSSARVDNCWRNEGGGKALRVCPLPKGKTFTIELSND